MQTRHAQSLTKQPFTQGEVPSDLFSLGAAVQAAGPWSFVGQARLAGLFSQRMQEVGVSEHAGVIAVVALLLDAYLQTGGVELSIRKKMEPVASSIPVPMTPDITVAEVLRGIDRELDRVTSPAPKNPVADSNTAGCAVLLDYRHEDPLIAVQAAGDDLVLCFYWDGSSSEPAIRVFARQDRFAGWLTLQLVEHLRHVLDSWMREPELRLSDLRLLTETEEQDVLRMSRGPRRAYDLRHSLSNHFLERVVRSPDAVALIERRGDGSISIMTYSDVEACVSNCAAEVLRFVEPESSGPVAIFVERSCRSVIALLTALRLGLTCVPLDSSYPDEYVRFILEDTQARIALTDPSLPMDRMPAHVRQLSLGCDTKRGTQVPVAPRATDAPFLIMYTSGSTGKPKGVVHCERQVINRLHWMWDTYPFLSSDRIAHRSPVTVMPSMWEALGGLLGGVPTVVISNQTIRDPALFVEQLTQDRVTFITLTPAIMRLMLDECERSGMKMGWLRVVIIGGEAFSHDLVDRFHKSCPNAALVNDFGATEVNTVLHHPYPSSIDRASHDPGFRPIANVDSFVLDRQLRPLACGIEGELVIGGVSVALGYHRLPETETGRFPARMLERAGGVERLYRTGEAAYMTSWGEVKILGRRDHQVKVNGMRVELGHVERQLADFPGVTQCAVLLEQRSEERAVLRAYIAQKPGALLTRASLWTFLESRLPAYMVPGELTCMDALPRLANGKIDRLSLAALSRQGDAARSGASAPKDDWTRLLLECVSAVINAQPNEIDPNASFQSLGLDSITIVRAARAMQDRAGQPVSPSLLFSFPTVAALAGELARRSPGFASPQSSPITATPRHRAYGDALAIIGIGCQFPDAKEVDTFWANLCRGVDSVGTSTHGRWDPQACYSEDPVAADRSYSKWGGFLEGAANFDPLFFGLTQDEARSMDPQQRLALMETWHALEDAGYAGPALAEQTIGVFIGAGDSGYTKVLAGASLPASANTMLGNETALIANRVSYFLDTNGPSMVVSTACSSSLVAVHLAARSLLAGECTIALAGGVFVAAHQDFFIGTSKLNIFSPTGQSRAFDSAANGLVHGEGAGFVLLKPLEAAIADGDHIYSVLRGTAINQDGRSNGITAPKGSAQAALQTSLYRKLGINPESIGYVEAHGTGTRLGDPIEVEALASSFGQFTSRRRYCALGSVKTNIGHLTAAAGIAGLIKSSLCLYHRELVPTLHFNTVNPMIQIDESPFYVNTAHRAWDAEDGAPRRAAMNAFGIGGTNCHAVLEEYLEPQRSAAPPSRAWFPIPLTCHSASSLAPTLRLYRDWSLGSGAGQEIRDLSYTLLAGRRQFATGYVLVASTMADLRLAIEQALDDACSPDIVRFTEASSALENKATQAIENYTRLRGHVEARTIASLVAASCRDWRSLFTGLAPRRIRIPVCVFQERRYWPEASDVSAPPAAAVVDPNPLRETYSFAAVLSDALGIAESQINKNLTLADYGFDSLRTIALQHRLARDLGVQVTLESLLGDCAIGSLAEQIAETCDSRPIACRASSISIARSFLDGEIDIADISENELDELYIELSRELTNDHA